MPAIYIKHLFMLVTCLLLMLAVLSTVQAGTLEPTSPPGPTMRPLDELNGAWSQTLPANERFVLVMGSAGVLDKETGLVWEQNPSTTLHDWTDAITFCNLKTLGNRMGWRLPTIEELGSLVDPSITTSIPHLPPGHPFTNVQVELPSGLQDFYWSATTNNDRADSAETMSFKVASTGLNLKTQTLYVWCVRGGHGYDAH